MPVRTVASQEMTREEELTELVRDLAATLQRVLAQRPAGNAVRVLGAAEHLTKGTDFEFRRSPR